MSDDCRHWWINWGTYVKRNGAWMVEYHCEICGKVEYCPVPAKDGPGNGKYNPTRGRRRKKGEKK